jgi:hypothetical protein
MKGNHIKLGKLIISQADKHGMGISGGAEEGTVELFDGYVVEGYKDIATLVDALIYFQNNGELPSAEQQRELDEEMQEDYYYEELSIDDLQLAEAERREELNELHKNQQ